MIRSEPDCNIFIIGVEFQLQKLLLKKRDRCEIEDSAGREGTGWNHTGPQGLYHHLLHFLAFIVAITTYYHTPHQSLTTP